MTASKSDVWLSHKTGNLPLDLGVDRALRWRAWTPYFVAGEDCTQERLSGIAPNGHWREARTNIAVGCPLPPPRPVSKHTNWSVWNRAHVGTDGN